ncbi:MAG: hypothetical protein E7042_02440 [Lentisphaerae bacterium]|nr:hypothetical protein [Lentisphaerota bacterium]
MENKESSGEPFMLEGDRCPQCREQLTPADLENFPRCPYCDHRFPNGAELEDFILKPALQRWMSHACQQFPR